MKSLVQYVLAVVLVLLGIALLCHPSHPAETTSALQPGQSDNSQVAQRPVPRTLMRLA